ncbi:uncharacterized protein LOC126336681 [Schistocerca gregaria]|uniref:uncharacterized protein LOC126336681 n=1 Tax=Schistocerca gregaria TaxID=7010 RepID=UPI00211DB57D|nr:uncharacterized protein LOC126336681 [Schistocerca gregaria]
MYLLVASALLLLAGCASARPEAPAQQYGAPDAAPYPPSGWRPEGRQFFLPSRSSGLYAPPPQQYGPPPPPAPTTTEAAETTTTELPTTTAPSDAAAGGSRALESGVYYLLQPDGRLQRITYAHGPAAPASASTPAASPLLPERLSLAADPGFLARFHYQDLLPQGAPVFAFRQAGLMRIF